MISAKELIGLPYTPDLTEAGILQAKRGLARLQMADGRAIYDSFHRAMAGTAADLAFRRHLAGCGIGFRAQPPLPFVEASEHAVMIKDRAWILKTYLIMRREQVALLESEPDLALRALALVPVDRTMDESLRPDDALIFCLVTANLPRPPSEGAQQGVGTREFWFHILPLAWRRPRNWGPLGPLVLRADAPHELEIGGEDSSGKFSETVVKLVPGEPKELVNDFNALCFIHARSRPAARLVLRLPARDRAHEIMPGDWRDMWIDGTSILLLGWISVEQYRARAKLIPAGARVFQFDRTKTTNLALEVSRLRPIAGLLVSKA